MQKTLYIPIDTTINNEVECTKLIKRGDTLTLTIKVFVNGVLADLTGQSVDIIFKKSDGTKIEKTVDVTNISNGVISVKPGQQSSLAAGDVYGELQIYTSDTLSCTNTFKYTVDASLADDIVEISKDDIQVLADLRNLIENGQVTINKYENSVLAIGNTVEAIEALANIKAYIDTNLQTLESENAKAVVNISKLKTENDKAPTLTANLKIQNDSATSNISTLTTKNAEAITNNKNLEDSISTASTSKTALDTSNSTANTTKTALNTSISNANTSKASLDTSISNGNTLITNINNQNSRAENNIISLQNFGNINVDGGTFFETYIDWTTNGGTF